MIAKIAAEWDAAMRQARDIAKTMPEFKGRETREELLNLANAIFIRNAIKSGKEDS